MTDKVCDCQFCKDHKWLVNELLPVVPEQHRKRLEEFFSWAWSVDEDLSYKRAILDGSWPSAVEILEHHLANAKARKAIAEAPKPETPVYEEEVDEDPYTMGDHQGNFF